MHTIRWKPVAELPPANISERTPTTGGAYKPTTHLGRVVGYEGAVLGFIESKAPHALMLIPAQYRPDRIVSGLNAAIRTRDLSSVVRVARRGDSVYLTSTVGTDRSEFRTLCRTALSSYAHDDTITEARIPVPEALGMAAAYRMVHNYRRALNVPWVRVHMSRDSREIVLGRVW